MTAAHLHHRISRCLLRTYTKAHEGDLDTAGLQAWVDWEEEAFRYGVDSDVSRVKLSALIETSAAPIPASDHRRHHWEVGDFCRWGRQGGLATSALYGRPWFSLLGRRRWGRIGTEGLNGYKAERLAKKRGVT